VENVHEIEVVKQIGLRVPGAPVPWVRPKDGADVSVESLLGLGATSLLLLSALLTSLSRSEWNRAGTFTPIDFRPLRCSDECGRDLEIC
jgi:hypothetical protein